VYCKDSRRPGSHEHEHEHESLTFLGYTFRPRRARRNDGVRSTSFSPAISRDALKKISAEVRSWRLHRHTGMTSADIARWINPKIRGWMAYHGAFRRSELYFPAPPGQHLPDPVADEEVRALRDLEERRQRLE
jgi:hypothetical protein